MPAPNLPIELHQFVSAMFQADEFPTVTEVIEFLEKPHHYEDEWALWQSCGKPDEGDPGWEEFVEGLD
jgi:hypothetical protein